MPLATGKHSHRAIARRLTTPRRSCTYEGYFALTPTARTRAHVYFLNAALQTRSEHAVVSWP